MKASFDFDDDLYALADKIAECMLLRDHERIGPTEAARKLGFSRDYFSPARYPWRVPHFGARGVMWPAWKWQRWNEVPDYARRRQWDAMPLRQRQAIVGVVEKKRGAA